MRQARAIFATFCASIIYPFEFVVITDFCYGESQIQKPAGRGFYYVNAYLASRLVLPSSYLRMPQSDWIESDNQMHGDLAMSTEMMDGWVDEWIMGAFHEIMFRVV